MNICFLVYIGKEYWVLQTNSAYKPAAIDHVRKQCVLLFHSDYRKAKIYQEKIEGVAVSHWL